MSVPEDKPRRGSNSWADIPGLGELLRAIREHHGLTQQQLADRAGISAATVARIESGERRPSFRVLDRIATALGTTRSDLETAAPRTTDESMSLAAEIRARFEDLDVQASPLPPAHLERGPLADAIPEEVETLTHVLELLRSSDMRERSEEERRHFIRRLAEEAAHPAHEAPRVATMDTGRVWYVFAREIGQDERGELWINPHARAFPGGYEREDPRVERYEGGQVIIDLRDLPDDVRFNVHDPTRHRTRLLVAGAELDDLTAAYASTVLEIEWEGGTRTIVEPLPDGVTDGAFPQNTSLIHVITAWNPRSRLLDADANEERNRYLKADLEAAGARYVPAVGRSPAGSWREASFAVMDAEADWILELADRHEQNAVFEWDSSHWAVRWTSAARAPVRQGWTAREI